MNHTLTIYMHLIEVLQYLCVVQWISIQLNSEKNGRCCPLVQQFAAVHAGHVCAPLLLHRRPSFRATVAVAIVQLVSPLNRTLPR